MSDLRELRLLEQQFFRAPSAHNTQPWLLDYSPAEVGLRFDPERALPLGDPTRRDLFLSLGALVEAVLIASAAAGLAVEFRTDLDEETRVGSFVRATASYRTSFDPGDLEHRRTSRLAYEPGRLADDDLRAARRELGTEEMLSEVSGAEIVDLYVQADRHLYDSPEVVEELRSWLRLSRRHSRAAQDGLSRDCLALGRAEALAFAFMLRPRVYPLVRFLRLHRTFTRSTTSLVERGSILMLAGPARTPETLLDHGRSLLRVWLALGRRGYYTHPLSQILDDPMTEHELASRLALGDETRLLSVFRVGRSAQPSRSARLV